MLKVSWKILTVLYLVLFSCSSEVEQIVGPEKEEVVVDSPNVKPYNANRLFIKHGLQLSTWAANRFDINRSGTYDICQDDWDKLQFRSCHGLQPTLLNNDWDMQWGLKMAPFGKHLYKGEGLPILPTDYQKVNGFLAPEQKDYLSQLTNFIFGDEEDYSDMLINQLNEWYQVCRKFYPDVLVQNNQYGPQWTEEQLTIYAQKCKPDVLTYDTYFLTNLNYGIFINGTAERLAKYRKVALKGLDGKGINIPAFGQYTMGWHDDPAFTITESQLRANYWMTWVYGGKWQSFFRWMYNEPISLIFTDGVPGAYNEYTDIISACNKESKNIGNHLVRLQTSKITLVNGTAPYTYDVNSNHATRWSQSTDDFIVEIDNVVNNTSLKADLFIGYYDIIPTEKNGDPKYFKDDNDQFFMIMNPVHNNKKVLDADENAQEVTLTIDYMHYPGKILKMVQRSTGEIVPIVGEDIGERKFKYTIVIPGGTGELFCLGTNV